MNIIEDLCKEYTALCEDEIQVIKDAAKSLPAIASMFNADAFIDCQMNDGSGDAIVVYEAKPIDSPSSYEKTVVGLVASKEKEPAVHRTFQLSVPTKFMKAVTQENAHVIQTVEPIFSANGVIGVFIVEQKMERISHLNQADLNNKHEREYDDKILRNKNGSSKFTDNIEDGILFIDNDNNVVFRNVAAAEIHKRLGFLNDIKGANYKEICIAKMPDDERNGGITVEEVKFGSFYFKVKTIFVDSEDINYIVTISDITSSKIQEKEIVLKSVAFTEMHHRVKNNLQTIAALLRLQRDNVQDELVKKALNETITRILAISSTHQLLIETDIEEVCFNDICANIRDNMLMYFASKDFKLSIEFHGVDFNIKYEKANALALILNELMQNSIKHGFKNRKDGRIVVMCFVKEVDYIELIYKDDGLGFDTEKTDKGGIGWTIINLMVKEKLKGHISVKSTSEGTRVKLVF